MPDNSAPQAAPDDNWLDAFCATCGGGDHATTSCPNLFDYTHPASAPQAGTTAPARPKCRHRVCELNGCMFPQDCDRDRAAASPPVAGTPEPAGDYLVWSVNRAAWWGPNRGGYTTVLSGAGRYTKAEAEEIARIPQHRCGFANEGPSEIAVPLADELAKLPSAVAGTPPVDLEAIKADIAKARDMTGLRIAQHFPALIAEIERLRLEIHQLREAHQWG